MSKLWIQFFGGQTDRINQGAAVVVFKQLKTQGAAVATTSFATETLSPGLYRVSYYARITRAATTSSSLTVTIGHTDGAVSITQVGAAITGNTTATVQSGTALMRVDTATAVTYGTAYSSTGSTSMQYRLDLAFEFLVGELG